MCICAECNSGPGDIIKRLKSKEKKKKTKDKVKKKHVNG